MNNLIIRILKFGALTGLAGTALMHAEQATFHLPVAAHWGKTLLQPGDYKMSLPDNSLGHPEFKIEGVGSAFFEYPVVADQMMNDASASHLVLKQVDGEYFVSGFTSVASGKDFKFSTPKRVLHREEAKSANKSDDLMISTK